VSPGLAAVTGATGFLGQHVVRALADAGWRVRILARRDPISPFWRGLAPEVIIGGLADPPALARLCDGADVVVHAAGQLFGDNRQLHEVNVEGSRRLALAAGPTARVLQISSIAAREPGLSPYAASKRAGEEVALAVLGERATIVRPSAIYGPGDRETLRLFQLAARSPILPVLSPKARLAMIHVQDAARQIVALTERITPVAVTLSDGRPEGYSWRELMETAALATSQNPKIVHIPVAALYAFASIEALSIVWRRKSTMLTFGKVRELTHFDWGLQTRERLADAPAPVFDLLSGFRQTVGWYRSQGWLHGF
jgi:nucleoside-diphosphate-sugar epimerase